jgi:hypothetical protein
MRKSTQKRLQRNPTHFEELTRRTRDKRAEQEKRYWREELRGRLLRALELLDGRPQ